MGFKTEITVRHYECDLYGHVNNANYLNYLEHARGEFLKDINFDYNGFVKAGFGIYVVKVEISYKSAAFPDDLLEIYTESNNRKRATGTFHQIIKRGDTLICEANVTWASIGQNGKLQAIPQEWNVSGLN